MLSLVAEGMGVALIPASLNGLFPGRIKVTPLGKDAPRADVFLSQR